MLYFLCWSLHFLSLMRTRAVKPEATQVPILWQIFWVSLEWQEVLTVWFPFNHWSVRRGAIKSSTEHSNSVSRLSSLVKTSLFCSIDFLLLLNNFNTFLHITRSMVFTNGHNLLTSCFERSRCYFSLSSSLFSLSAMEQLILFFKMSLAI